MPSQGGEEAKAQEIAVRLVTGPFVKKAIPVRGGAALADAMITKNAVVKWERAAVLTIGEMESSRAAVESTAVEILKSNSSISNKKLKIRTI